jgi:uncharacterized protein (UPF0335 family)
MSNGLNSTELRGFVDRITRLKDEQKSLGEDIKSVKEEAKSAGFSPKMISKAMALAAMPKEERQELELYTTALGLFD